MEKDFEKVDLAEDFGDDDIGPGEIPEEARKDGEEDE